MDNVTPLYPERDRQPARLPPFNTEAERGLLGSILLNNRAYDRVCDFLSAEHFFDPVNSRIYSCLQKLIDGGHQANTVTLKTYLERDDLVIAAGGMKYLANVTNSIVTTHSIADYGHLIHDLFLRREMINIGEDIVNRAYDSSVEETAQHQLEMAASQVSDLLSADTRGTSVTLAQAVREVTKRWEQHDRGELAGLSSGIKDLDADMGLLEDGDMIVLAGSPGAGKTALAVTVAYNAASAFQAQAVNGKPKRALVFSTEMSYLELASRAMTTHTGIQGPRRRHKPLDTVDWANITNWEQHIESLPLDIDDRGGPSLAYIRSRCRQAQRTGGIGLVVVDYLQIMGGEPGRRGESRTEEVGRNSMGLKHLARQFKCPVIVLSSLNRQYNDRDNKRPQMSDLRASGDIEHAADIIAFCHREEYYLERSEPDEGSKDHGVWQMKMDKWRDKAEIIIAKARFGSSGSTTLLSFQKNRTLFADSAASVESFSDPRLF